MESNTTPLWKELNEKRTQGEWVAKPKRGNNIYEYSVIVPNIKTICEMEATHLGDVKTTAANAGYTALCVNNFKEVVEALEEMLWAAENGEAEAQKQGRKRYIERLEQTRNALSKIS